MARSNEPNELAGLKRDLATVYTPSTPIVDPSLFSGREELLALLSAQLGQTGTHFVLYGERGVGKTSLWQVLLADRPLRRHSASASDDFLSIFLPLLEELDDQFTAEERQRMIAAGASFGPPGLVTVKAEESAGSTDTAVAKRKVDLNLVLERVRRNAGRIDAIVIDEFHNVSSPLVQEQLIELAKGLSDQGIAVQLFLVGVADSDDELISDPEYEEGKVRHFSVSRVPRLNDEEIREILDLRRQRFSVELEADVKDAIVSIAAGYPWVAHHLALQAAQNWATRAFTGYALGLLASILNVVMGTALSGATAVKKAGVRVAEEDLRAAAQRFVAVFDDGHGAAAAGYGEVRNSPSREAFEAVLEALGSSSSAQVEVAALATQLDTTPGQLEVLLADGFGLVEKSGTGYELAFRELRPYLKAKQYLDGA